jgi:hypothetical protein
MPIEAIRRLEQSLHLLTISQQSTEPEDRKPLELAGEVAAHRQVLTTIQSLRKEGVPLPLGEFDEWYRKTLADVYFDANTVFSDGATSGESNLLFLNYDKNAACRPLFIARLTTLIAVISTLLPDTLLRDVLVASSSTCSCALVVHLSREVARWIRAQSTVGEESITDWILYQLAALVPWVCAVKFNRREEAFNGADWEWWFVGVKKSFGMRVQAKKFHGVSDVYPLLTYTNRLGLQVETLIDQSNAKDLFPVYAIYHTGEGVPAKACEVCLSCGSSGQGIFLGNAKEWYERHVLSGRAKISPHDVLGRSVPLTCLFCCGHAVQGIDHVERIAQFIATTIGGRDDRSESVLPGMRTEPPAYVTALLRSGHETIEWRTEFAEQLLEVNGLVVFDLRRRGTLNVGAPNSRLTPG